MCGIVGQFELRRPIDRSNFDQMLDTLAFRGPDGRGVYFSENERAALGHQRLSIIDLSSSANQPMPNEDKTIWLICNGEIYNHRGLRKELITAGHRFRSNSDCEVIVHAYEQWGFECIHRFRGIFAFGIWDANTSTVFLARDHLGVKPLYYWRDKQTFAFASQPRALLTQSCLEPRLSGSAFGMYLAYGYVPGNQSIYQDIKKLPAGNYLVHEAGTLKLQEYWRPQYQPEPGTLADAERRILAQFEESVRLQMMSDVPVGVFLSGGIDSASVASFMVEYAHDPLNSFTVGFRDPKEDERGYARLTAQRVGSIHHESTMDFDSGVGAIEDFIRAYDEPFYDSSALPTLLVSKMARNSGIKVILTGDGGDELFLGYRRYERYMRGNRSPQATEDRVAEYFPLVGFCDKGLQKLLLTERAFDEVYDYLSPLLANHDHHHSDATALRMMDLRTYLVDDLLTKIDRAAMLNGVETRVPFLDHKLVELVLSIDSGLLFENGQSKEFLKRIMSNRLPLEVINAPKKGFSVPMAKWLSLGLVQNAHQLLVEGSLVSRGVIRLDGLSQVLSMNQFTYTWLLLSAELWARYWLEGESTHRLSEAAIPLSESSLPI